MLRVGVLGPVTAWNGHEELRVGQPRQQAVLGILAMRANRVISRGELVDAVWGQDPPASAEGGIYTYVAGLRRIIEPTRSARGPGRVLVSSGAGYVLHLVPGQPDAVAFEQHLGRARQLRKNGDPAGAVDPLEAALGLWRGAAFAGVPGPFAETERVRLAELRSGAAEERADVLLDAGPPRGGRARPDRAGGGPSAAGADARAADDRAVPQRPPRRGAAGVPGRKARARRGARHRSRHRPVPHSPADADLGSRAEPGRRRSRGRNARAGPDGRGTSADAGAGQSPAAPQTAAGMADGSRAVAQRYHRCRPGSGTRGIGRRPSCPAGLPAREWAQRRRGPPAAPAFPSRPSCRWTRRASPAATTSSARCRRCCRRPRPPRPDEPVPVVVISGTAGVGKTALAIRFGRQVAKRFPDGQLYVNLRGLDPGTAHGTGRGAAVLPRRLRRPAAPDRRSA